MAHTYIKYLFVCDLNLTWNPAVLWLAKPGNPNISTMRRHASSPKACRFRKHGSQENTSIDVSQLDVQNNKIHTLTAPECGSLLPQHPWKAGKTWSLWEDRWTKVDKIPHGAALDCGLLRLLVWTLFAPGFLEYAFSQPGLFMTQTVFIARDPPIGEHLLSPNKICF